MKKLGLIVNPIAGIGGRVGLKGSDGQDIVDEAIRLGAVSVSPRRAMESLRELTGLKDQFELITYPFDMGENEAREVGLTPTVIGAVSEDRTTAEDTKQAARDMLAQGVDLLLFAGGDGTARDIYEAIGDRLPSLGIPAGVKIHSAVYAVNPRSAGRIAARYLTNDHSTIQLSKREVMDIDEQAFRQGRLEARLYGYLCVPGDEEKIQDVKGTTVPGEMAALEAVAQDTIDMMEDDSLYIIGPGTTTGAIMKKLGLKNTLLGVDAVYNGELIGSDLNETELLKLMRNRRTRIIVTVIGRQGFIFGRGNQQISPEILRKVGKDNVIVVATKEKILGLGGRPLGVDTGAPEVDKMLCGYYQVITGFGERMVIKATS